MKIRFTLFIGFLFALFIAGCSSTSEKPQEVSPIKLMDQGYIIKAEEGNQHLLITEWLDNSQHGSAAWLTVDEETTITDSKQNKVSLEALRTGYRVEVWSQGSVTESSPVQAKAARIIVKSTEDEALAVAQSLSYLKDSKELRYIGEADYLQEEDRWKIQIIELGSTHELFVNLQSNEVIEQVKEPDSHRGDEPGLDSDSSDIGAENETFRIFEPKPDTIIDKTLTVRGEARVFEAMLSYSLEDGHVILAEGHVQASQGAPEWGSFEIETTLLQQPTSPAGVLTIYEVSAKDGSPVHQLHIPVKFKDFK